MKPQEVIQELNRQIDGRDDVIITTGVGQHQMFAAQFIEWHRPWSWVSSGGLGAWSQRCDACARLCDDYDFARLTHNSARFPCATGVLQPCFATVFASIVSLPLSPCHHRHHRHHRRHHHHHRRRRRRRHLLMVAPL